MTQQLTTVLDLDKLFEAKTLSPEHLKQLEALGFVLFSNEDDGYTDLEYEVTFENGNSPSDLHRRSVNLHFSFDWDEQKVYQTVGLNLGSGFDGELSIRDEGPDDFARQIVEEWELNSGNTSSTLQQAFQMPAVRTEILSAAQRLSRLFQRRIN